MLPLIYTTRCQLMVYGEHPLATENNTRRNMLAKTVLALCLLAACSAKSLSNNGRVVDTVTELDLTKYVGRWYQVFGNRFGWLSYGDDAVCNTATYTAISADSVSVLNHNRKDIGTGFERFIRGSATKTEEVGKFELRLDGVPFVGSYWVIRLGPVLDDQYDYAVVTNADASTLFVLSRNVQRFGELYEADVLAFLEEQGFTDYWTLPIPDFHPDDCQYPPLDF